MGTLGPRTCSPGCGPGILREKARVPSVPRELTAQWLSGEGWLHKPLKESHDVVRGPFPGPGHIAARLVVEIRSEHAGRVTQGGRGLASCGTCNSASAEDRWRLSSVNGTGPNRAIQTFQDWQCRRFPWRRMGDPRAQLPHLHALVACGPPSLPPSPLQKPKLGAREGSTEDSRPDRTRG